MLNSENKKIKRGQVKKWTKKKGGEIKKWIKKKSDQINKIANNPKSKRGFFIRTILSPSRKIVPLILTNLLIMTISSSQPAVAKIPVNLAQNHHKTNNAVRLTFNRPAEPSGKLLVRKRKRKNYSSSNNNNILKQLKINGLDNRPSIAHEKIRSHRFLPKSIKLDDGSGQELFLYFYEENIIGEKSHNIYVTGVNYEKDIIIQNCLKDAINEHFNSMANQDTQQLYTEIENLALLLGLNHKDLIQTCEDFSQTLETILSKHALPLRGGGFINDEDYVRSRRPEICTNDDARNRRPKTFMNDNVAGTYPPYWSKLSEKTKKKFKTYIKTYNPVDFIEETRVWSDDLFYAIRDIILADVRQENHRAILNNLLEFVYGLFTNTIDFSVVVKELARPLFRRGIPFHQWLTLVIVINIIISGSALMNMDHWRGKKEFNDNEEVRTKLILKLYEINLKIRNMNKANKSEEKKNPKIKFTNTFK